MNPKIKAFMDLLRLHFFFVWPVLFCAGLFFSFGLNGGFSITLVLQAVLIAFFGFEAGLVLNDILDAEIDRKELASDNALTKYWRPFGERPLPNALISLKQATAVFAVLVAITVGVIFTLPYPHSLYVFAIMLTCYCLEAFYQFKKRNEKYPVAQVVGRVDFALFLVAGYLCVGSPDFSALLLFLFFYPLALAHLGVNDLVDVANDKAKGMNTIPTLYGVNGTVYWILGFSVWQVAMAILFLTTLGTYLAIGGFTVSLLLLLVGTLKILQKRTPQAAIKALPLFHVAMLIYALTIIANYFVATFL
jgi:4-hydroxybenzoate polyprenyltransferase